MKTYSLKLLAEPSRSFYAVRAANSLDIDVEKKSLHEFSVTADVESDFRVGLIVGASGSGKSTLARHIFGDQCFRTRLESGRAVIDQFPEAMDYDSRATALNGIGLTSVPCWIKPAGTLSNGQQARAEAALALSDSSGTVVLDEWTSVVDRTVAKVMSHCVQKYSRKQNKKIVLVSCHYDVMEWLDPDWIIDCNSQRFIDRRGLLRQRQEQLQFDVREVSRSSWKNFSKYHYLSANYPAGRTFQYGLFYGKQQIGFECFANYVPIRPGSIPIYHSNRTVIHPDYAGLGLGLRLINAGCKLVRQEFNGRVEIRATFSSEPLYRSRIKDPENWRLMRVTRPIGNKGDPGGSLIRRTSFRKNVKVYMFKYIGG